MASARGETEAIPPAVRAAAYQRDNGCCRVCGSTAAEPALHHIVYRSEGGLNVVENVVTVHWMYWPRCHETVHSNKRLWQPLLLEVVKHDGLNARQLLRWARTTQPRS
jgi:5-methylcytosine-specific restriction endonuclease McrA